MRNLRLQHGCHDCANAHETFCEDCGWAMDTVCLLGDARPDMCNRDMTLASVTAELEDDNKLRAEVETARRWYQRHTVQPWHICDDYTVRLPQQGDTDNG